MAKGFLSGDSLYHDVVTYTQFGEHRTATEVDLRTSAWIAEQLEAADLETNFHNFTTRQFFVREACLVVGGKRLECFPMWPPVGTGTQPIRAPLVVADEYESRKKGKILLLRLPYEYEVSPGSDANSKKRLRDIILSAIPKAVNAGVSAVVAITEGPAKEIITFNFPEWLDPWPVPVVLVGSRDAQVLTVAAERSDEISLLVDGTEEPQAETRNVIGSLSRGKDTIVITTPHSGWFRCGGERGPGLALFLGLARWVAQRQPHVSYLFNSNTGHELACLGMREFIKENAPPVEQVLCWIFLGKNIATWEFGESTDGFKRWAGPEKHLVTSRNPEFIPLLNDAFAGMPGVKPAVGDAPGELRHVPSEYRGFSLTSESYWFKHTPADGPDGTAPELLEPVGLALTRALESIEALARQ